MSGAGKKSSQSTNLYPNTASVNAKKYRFFNIARLLPRHIPIATKLAITIGILLTLVMALLGALIVNNQTQLLTKQTHSTGRTLVHQMAESAKEMLLANDVLQMEILAYNLATSENILGTAIYSTDYKLLASSGQTPFQPYAPFENRVKEYLNGNTNILPWTWDASPKGSVDAISFMAPVRFKNITAGYVMISFSQQPMNQAMKDVVQSILTVTLILIIVGILISYFLGKRLTRPIQHLIDASRAIGEGIYDYEIPDKRNDEIGYLMNSLNTMAKGLLEKEQVEKAFTQHVSPNIAKKILSNMEEVKLGGTHVFSTVMFVDIVGFTAKSESLPPNEVADMLNEFYTYVTSTVRLYKGTIDKYIGDCAMIVFGVTENDNDHVYNAIAYAVFLQNLAERINNIRISKGKFPMHYRIGINSGEMLAGNMGSSTRMQYTVVGDSVNLASRLASLANTDQIMISEETYKLQSVKGRIIAQKYQSLHVRGKSEPVSTFLVHDVVGVEQLKMEENVDRIIKSMEQYI